MAPTTVLPPPPAREVCAAYVAGRCWSSPTPKQIAAAQAVLDVLDRDPLTKFIKVGSWHRLQVAERKLLEAVHAPKTTSPAIEAARRVLAS